jgi:hypothetical protein
MEDRGLRVKKQPAGRRRSQEKQAENPAFPSSQPSAINPQPFRNFCRLMVFEFTEG